MKTVKDLGFLLYVVAFRMPHYFQSSEEPDHEARRRLYISPIVIPVESRR